MSEFIFVSDEEDLHDIPCSNSNELPDVEPMTNSENSSLNRVNANYGSDMTPDGQAIDHESDIEDGPPRPCPDYGTDIDPERWSKQCLGCFVAISSAIAVCYGLYKYFK